jgi:hypothetical protein
MKKKEWDAYLELVSEAKRPASMRPYLEIRVPTELFLAVHEELHRLHVALKCSADNCSELGRFHDGDCSECPQGTIRARAGLAGK